MTQSESFTAEGHTWTRDFCRWWFHLKLPEHCEIEGDYYILPRYWARANCGIDKLTIRRIYLELWSWNKEKVIDIGFLMFDQPEMPLILSASLAQQIKWMELEKYINVNKASLANIGLYGIEGAIKNSHLPPLTFLVEHVLKHVRLTENPEDEIVNVEWERYEEHMLDTRTAWEWQSAILASKLAGFGLKWHNGTATTAQVEAINKAGKKWLVRRYVEKEHNKET